MFTFLGGKSIGGMTDTLAVTDSSVDPGDHRRVRRSPISPSNTLLGKFGLKFFPAAGVLMKKIAMTVYKLIPVGLKLSVVNLALG